MAQNRCNECKKTWSGPDARHCLFCHETFSSELSGNAHRKRLSPEGFCCTTEGLVWNAKRAMWQMPGTWTPEEAA
ncbi:FDXHR family putative zinc-binding protein [Brevibacterium moorei]|uniref:FDXHR family putative zinc-binding protein n=1 Tax=Brevibacterium moorei TaxID=2968457 RepID=UPI00211D0AE0|nr:hypothetical protein [Brevibacterium sp. 68QC2CO]MCQ9384389.1 hypothetical protein [Brevibacterium sp. 68QC2CO]